MLVTTASDAASSSAAPVAAFGILTQQASSELNLAMLGAFAARATEQLILRLCLFADEVSEEEKAKTYIAVLDRPPHIPWPQVQCAAKILQWLKCAVEAYAAVPFVGWMDSDTWFEPQRFAAYLAAVRLAMPATKSIWGGIFMHYQRLDTNGTLGALGFGLQSPGLVYGWKDPDPVMLRRPKAMRREDSFAFTQGSFTYYSRTAATKLVSYVARHHQAVHFLAHRGAAQPPPSVPGVCAAPGDVSMGWLGARAFREQPLQCVHVHMDFEAYIRPPYLSRLNASYACAPAPVYMRPSHTAKHTRCERWRIMRWCVWTVIRSFCAWHEAH
jgi:hypothetical protein